MPDPGAQAAISADGSRLHLQHGPIDLIVGAEGSPDARAGAWHAACARFDGLLAELVAELPLLRTALGPGPRLASPPAGPVAARMVAAVGPHRHDEPVTPMAAVAGAVADEVGAAMAAAAPLDRWFVNNGGDIALGLAPGQQYRTGLVVDPRRAAGPTVTVEAASGVRGIATSGRHGRSLSMGIADAVTVLAPSAAAADAAATLIANRVDLGPHPAITRRPAVALDPDSDLRDRLVVVDVGALSTAEVGVALERGLAPAESYVARGLIAAAVLHLRGRTAVTSAVPGVSLESTGAGPLAGSALR